MARDKRKPITLTLELTGARETLKAFKDLPKDASIELKAAAGQVSQNMVAWVRAALASGDPQAAALVDTVKAVKDRVPAISVGGTKLVASTRTNAFNLLFGANFGAVTYRVKGVFPYFTRNHAGKGNDYYIWASVEAHAAEINNAWNAAAEAVIAKWADGGEAE